MIPGPIANYPLLSAIGIFILLINASGVAIPCNRTEGCPPLQNQRGELVPVSCEPALIVAMCPTGDEESCNSRQCLYAPYRADRLEWVD